MSNTIYESVITTLSKQERKILIDYLSEKDGMVISNIDDLEGQHIVGVSRGVITVLGIIPPMDILRGQYANMLFRCANEYISYLEDKQ